MSFESFQGDDRIFRYRDYEDEDDGLAHRSTDHYHLCLPVNAGDLEFLVVNSGYEELV